MDLIAFQEIEVWGSLQSDLQSQVHAVTQGSVAGLIIHVGKNEDVGGGKRHPAVQTPVKRRGGKKKQDRRSRWLTNLGTNERRTQFFLDKQQVLAHLGCGLISVRLPCKEPT